MRRREGAAAVLVYWIDWSFSTARVVVPHAILKYDVPTMRKAEKRAESKWKRCHDGAVGSWQQWTDKVLSKVFTNDERERRRWGLLKVEGSDTESLGRATGVSFLTTRTVAELTCRNPHQKTRARRDV